jgi:cytochrome b561
MVDLPISVTMLRAFAWHKWIGLVVLVLTVLRCLWRWYAPPPPLPDSVTPWHRRLSAVSHGLLLTLLLAMPVSGWLMSSAGGVTVYWFGYLQLPDLVPRDQLTFAMLRGLHHQLAWILIAVLVVHVLAVVHHDVLRRDGIFRRMRPFSG